jgi:ParB family transcriptional regulator, chromosome partitioning protein
MTRRQSRALTTEMLDSVDLPVDETGPVSATARHGTQAVRGLAAEIDELKSEQARAVNDGIQIISISPANIDEGLISDRGAAGFEDDEFRKLKASILESGQDQPIVVRPADNGRYELISGRRRTEACRQLGLDVLSRVKQLDDRTAIAEQFRENALRSNPSPIELGSWFVRIMDRFALTQLDLVKITGFTKSYVSELTMIGSMPQEIRGIFSHDRDLTKVLALSVMRHWNQSSANQKAMLKAVPTAREAETMSRKMEILLATDARKSASKADLDEIVGRGGRKVGVIERVRGKPRITIHNSLTEEQIDRLKVFLRDLTA